MEERYIYYNALFDIYEELLTTNEKDTFRDYYQEDLSLGEIADEKNVSRSAIQKTIKNVIDKLNHYESILHIYANNRILQDLLELSDIEKIKKGIKDLLNK